MRCGMISDTVNRSRTTKTQLYHNRILFCKCESSEVSRNKLTKFHQIIIYFSSIRIVHHVVHPVNGSVPMMQMKELPVERLPRDFISMPTRKHAFNSPISDVLEMQIVSRIVWLAISSVRALVSLLSKNKKHVLIHNSSLFFIGSSVSTIKSWWTIRLFSQNMSKTFLMCQKCVGWNEKRVLW